MTVPPLSAVWERVSQLLGSGAAAAAQSHALLAVLIIAASIAALVPLHRRHQRRMAGPPSTPVGPNQPDLANGHTTDHALGKKHHGFDDPNSVDPPLLQKHTEVKSYSTSRYTYPGIRTFYRRHPKADELPTSPAPIPLLVFIHGLGGSAAQFQPLLTTLIHVSSCLAIDLPGCGLSEFAPTSWAAYATDALLELLETVIDSYRENDANQGVVLIGHSMGAALSALLASKTSPCPTELSGHVLGLVAICPPSGPPSEQQVGLFRKLLWIPTPIFNLWRAWDRRGGTESASVRRFVGADADDEAKKLQDRFNNQSRTPVWRRMAWGALPVYKEGKANGGIPGRDVWVGLEMPVYLISGADDHVTPPTEADKIQRWLSGAMAPSNNRSGSRAVTDSSSTPPDSHSQGRQAVVDSAAPVDTSNLSEGSREGASSLDDGRSQIGELTDEDFQRSRQSVSASTEDAHDDPSTPREEPPAMPPLRTPPRRMVESVVLPPPATHALLYTPSTERVLAALVSDFLSTNVSGRLSLGWQLQYLSREGKWDVKNLAKWEKVAPVSDRIAGVFRAMKTLREVDDTHCPRAFVDSWGAEVRDIIDISHDTPVYDSRGLETAGVRYHKFPTVSKIPPTDDDVDAFIALVDKVRAEQRERVRGERGGDGQDRGKEGEDDGKEEGPGYMIGVHCHYGFNRTGYFIVCYLIERCGLEVQQAIDEFAQKRPQGIRHQHFLDKLFIRYSMLNRGQKASDGSGARLP